MFVTLLLILTIVKAGVAAWNYKTNGLDWPQVVIDNNNCGGSN